MPVARFPETGLVQPGACAWACSGQSLCDFYSSAACPARRAVTLHSVATQNSRRSATAPAAPGSLSQEGDTRMVKASPDVCVGRDGNGALPEFQAPSQNCGILLKRDSTPLTFWGIISDSQRNPDGCHPVQERRQVHRPRREGQARSKAVRAAAQRAGPDHETRQAMSSMRGARPRAKGCRT